MYRHTSEDDSRLITGRHVTLFVRYRTSIASWQQQFRVYSLYMAYTYVRGRVLVMGEEQKFG